MKKGLNSLKVLAALVAVTALAGCNETSYKEGVALQYTAPNGERVSYTTAELLADYQNSSTSASTDFDKIKEILIRKYYEGSNKLPELKRLANKDVDSIKQQAATNSTNNGTSYEKEFQTLLESEGCDNIEELYQKKLYDQEKSKYEHDYYSDAKKRAIRDGIDDNGNPTFPGYSGTAGEYNFGVGNKGYIQTRMPYHVSHILIEASSASETDPTSTSITSDESKTIGHIVELMAGADITKKGADSGKVAATSRTSFGVLAQQYSKDTGSGAKYGDLGIMDKATSFVQGFQFGVYSYDMLFNKKNQVPDTFGYTQKENLSWSDDAYFYNTKGEQVKLDDATEAGGVFESIGQIPYGAAVALADEDTAENFPTGRIFGTEKHNWNVNGGDSTYMPRNILFNKYFNKHRIAVITPNRIAYDDVVDGETTAVPSEFTYNPGVGAASEPSSLGVLDADYAALPGFQHDTTDILDGIGSNVLTTEQGKIILAVRGDSGTKGIHFIVVDRSPLVEYQKYVPQVGSEFHVAETATYADDAAYRADTNTDVTNLADYYTMYRVGSNEYPTYAVADEKVNKTTFVTNGVEKNASDYQKTIDSISSNVTSYNGAIDTYMFEELVKTTGVTFNTDNAIVKQIVDNITKHSQQQRQKAIDEATDKLDESWQKYAEFLCREDQARSYRKDGGQKLISENVAIDYLGTDSNPDSPAGMWTVGGLGYKK